MKTENTSPRVVHLFPKLPEPSLGDVRAYLDFVRGPWADLTKSVPTARVEKGVTRQ